MPSTTVTVAYRPIRVGLLVRRGVLSDVVRAVELATLTWGGAYNPIISIGGDHSSHEELIKTWLVDALLPVVDDADLTSVLAEHPHLALPDSRGEANPTSMSGSADPAKVVGAPFLISHYFNTYFSSTDSSAWIRPTWPSQHPLAGLFSVLFGRYGDEPPGPDYLSCYIRGLKAGEVQLVDRLLPHLSLEYTPLGLTRQGLSLPQAAVAPCVVVVGDPCSPETLVMLWNLRAVGARAVFWPTSHSELVKDHVCEFLHSLTRSTPGAQTAPLDLHLWSLDDTTQAERCPSDLAAVLPPNANLLDNGPDPFARHHSAYRPEIVTTAPQTQLAVVEDNGRGALQIVFGLPAHPFAVTSFQRSRQLWLTRVTYAGDLGVTTHTLRLPYLPDLDAWFDWELTDMFAGTRVDPAGVSVFTCPGASSLMLRLVDKEDLIVEVFMRAGLKAKRSAAGGAAAEITRLMGGLVECRRFRIRGIRELLRTERWRTWQDAKRMVAAGGLSDYPGATADGLLEFLTAQGAIRAGLRVQCPNCSIRHCYLPADLDESVRCPRCREYFGLGPFLHDAPWMFRASGFFADRGGHGSIPVLLAMMRLEQAAIGVTRFVAPSHELQGQGINCESDLLVLERHEDGRVAVAVAECKDQMNVEDADIDNLDAVSCALRGSGVEAYMILVTLRDAFAPEELATLRAYYTSIADAPALDVAGGAEAGRPAPILFSARELDKFEMYDDETVARLPHQRPRSLRELAENSAAMYFGAEPSGKRGRNLVPG